jgi:iron complex transport system ATP-binding protein
VSWLEFDDVGIELGGRRILSELSLRVAQGELLTLLGPNGAGKTSLLRAALGLTAPAQGQVLVLGGDVRRLSARERAAAVAWLPQSALSLEPLRVIEVVRAGRFRFEESQRASEAAARGALERVSASAFADARITELSGGERQRVLFASLLAQDARGVLLDEPASHLDPAQQIETYRLLGELWSAGLGVVLVTHDVNLLGQLGSPERVRVAGISAGRLQFESSYAAADLADSMGRLFKVNFVAIQHGGRRLMFVHPPATAESSG